MPDAVDSPDAVVGHRPRLLGLAYRMLGDMDEAEDVVQEAYVRWFGDDRDDVRVPEAWLVTVVTRIAVDRLRRLRTERATYPGPWLPEPIATDAWTPAGQTAAPDRGTELASDLSVALLVLLERLGPEERAAFLLRDVFGTEYAEIARILERRPAAVRQMIHRARQRVRDERPRVDVPPAMHEALVERFVAALAADDAPAVLALLAPEVDVVSDGGGLAIAARRRIVGPDRVARFLLGVGRKLAERDATQRIAPLNGRPALLTFEGDVLTTATVLDVADGLIRGIYLVRNPRKLRRARSAGTPIV